MVRSTGDPALDALIASHPAIGRYLDRETRYAQSRWTEIWLSCIMAVFGAVLLADGETFSLGSYRVVRQFVSEETAGLIAVAVGAARLVALWYNGSRRRSPLVRIAGCGGGFLFYTALTVGFLMSAPPIPTGIIYGVLAVAELHSSGRASRDASVLDSLGIRQRRRDRGHRAARD